MAHTKLTHDSGELKSFTWFKSESLELPISLIRVRRVFPNNLELNIKIINKFKNIQNCSKSLAVANMPASSPEDQRNTYGLFGRIAFTLLKQQSGTIWKVSSENTTFSFYNDVQMR